MKDWQKLNNRIIQCKKCPRLRAYCAEIAKTKKRAFMDWDYWGKPVPGFGDTQAKIWIVGLAPAAHGANRTGRMFTGDESGNWLYRVLHENGLANQPQSSAKTDSLKLNGVYISASARCAPPENKPTREEILNCSSFLIEESQLLTQVQVVIPLGKIAWDTLCKIFPEKKKKAPFQHGAQTTLNKWTVVMSYHPSQQNTFTKRLTWEMWDSVFKTAKKLL